MVSIRLGNSKVTLGASGPPFPAMCFTYNAAPVVCNTFTIDVQNSIVHTVVQASLKPFTIMVLDNPVIVLPGERQNGYSWLHLV